MKAYNKVLTIIGIGITTAALGVAGFNLTNKSENVEIVEAKYIELSPNYGAIQMEQITPIPTEPVSKANIPDKTPESAVQDEYGWSIRDNACMTEMKKKFSVMFKAGGEDRAVSFYRNLISNYNAIGNPMTFCDWYLNLTKNVVEDANFDSGAVPSGCYMEAAKFPSMREEYFFYKGVRV